MIPGVTAGRGTIHRFTLPDASGQWDFVNHSYSWGATTLTAANVVDQIGWIGTGLVVPANSVANIIYSAATTLLATAEFTMVMEVNIPASTNGIVPFWISNSGQAYYIELEVSTGTGGTEWDLFDNDGSSSGDAYVAPASGGIHKVAFSRSNNDRAISVDGSPVSALDGSIDTTTVTLPVGGFPMAQFCFGGIPSGTQPTCTIRAASFYSLQPDSILPGLST